VPDGPWQYWTREGELDPTRAKVFVDGVETEG
jgi:hypothetical protein